MAVYGSPFSSRTRDFSQPVGPTPEQLTIVNKMKKTAEDRGTTFGEEKGELASSVYSAIDRVAADPKLSENDKLKAVREILDIQRGKDSSEGKGGLWKYAKGSVNMIVNPLKAVWDLRRPINNLGQSAVGEITKSALGVRKIGYDAQQEAASNPNLSSWDKFVLQFKKQITGPPAYDVYTRPSAVKSEAALSVAFDEGVFKPEDMRPSWDTFVRNAKSDDWYNVAEDVSVYKYGLSPAGKAVTNFGFQTLFDPLTYVGIGPATRIGQSARIALATELVGKYGDLIPVDDVIRFGVTKVPKAIREAEGLQMGLRFAGKIVPKTEFVEQAFARTGGALRAKVGDVVFSPKAGPLRDFAMKLTPKSSKALVEIGVGRGKNISNETIKKLVGTFSSAKHAKGVTAVQHMQWQNDVIGFAKRAREMLGRGVAGKLPSAVYDAEAGNLYRYLEMPQSQVDSLTTITPELKTLVKDVREWQDGVRATVNEARQKFGQDFNVSYTDIGYIDDYVHHRVTKEARDFMLSEAGATAGRQGLYRGLAVEARDLTDSQGALMYRRLRAPHVDPVTGNVVAETFFGQQVQTGTIDEINKIFGDWLESQGMKRANWFETDTVSILDSYSFSMAKAMGNIAFARRAWDFGGDVIKPLLKRVIPDDAVLASLLKAQDDLLSVSRTLRTRIDSNTILAKDYAKSGLDYARKVLSGGLKKVKLNEQEVARTQRLLNNAQERLAEASARASTIEATMRGEFNTMHSVLNDQIAELRAALDSPERYAAAVELRNIYAQMYPNHNPQTLAGRSPEWLAEKIMHMKGMPAARELRGVTERIEALRAIIDEIPDGPAYEAARAELTSKFAEYEQFEEAFQTLGRVRMEATYSRDGFVFGVAEDLGVMPDEVGYKVFRTMPEYMDSGFATRADAVAVQAPAEEALADFRDPDTYNALLSVWDDVGGEMTNPFADSLAASLERAGFGEFGEVFLSEYRNRAMTGAFDPMFEQTYPEVANLIDTIMFHGTVPTGDIVGDQTIWDFFNAVDDQLRRVIDLPEGEIDQMVRQLLDDTMGDLSHRVGVFGREGLLMPQSIIDNTQLEELADQWAIIVPPSRKFGPAGARVSTDPTAAIQPVANSKMAQITLSDAYEEAWTQLDDVMGRAANEITSMDDARALLPEYQAELRSARGQLGGMKSAAKRRLKKAEQAAETLARTDSVEVMVDGVPQMVSRQQAQDQLSRVEGNMAELLAEFEKRVDDVYARAGLTRAGTPASGSRYPIERHGERLAMLMDEATVLKQWNDDVATVLARDIQDLHTLLVQRPPKGAAAGEAAAWVRKIDRTLQSAGGIEDPVIRSAYERVTSILHADEAQLAVLEGVSLPNIQRQLNMVQSGQVGKLIEVTEQGWSALAGMGVQMPDELIALWKPNLDKLRNPVFRNKYFKAYKYTVDFFKTYATSTVGFFVRNGMSATFMNTVAGVAPENMIDGFRAARAISQGGDAWQQFLAKLPDDETRRLYQKAWEVAESTGRGQADDLAAPTLRGGFGERALNNAYTRAFRRKNEFVERAVRLPMALDSLKKGMGFDEAAARVTRYHFDYSDLSSLDVAARQVVPFWIWTSRNVPLQVTSQIMHPSAYAMYERIQRNNEVGSEIMMPKWMSAYGPIALGGPDEQGGQRVLMPDLPMMRLNQQAEQFVNPKKLVGQLAPIIKVPIEVAIANRQLGLDVGPFKDRPQPVGGFDKTVLVPIARVMAGDAWQGVDPETGEVLLDERFPYIAQNAMPLLAQMNRVTGGITGGRQSSSYKERQLSSILNWFGVPFRYVGPEQQKAEATSRQFDLADYLSRQVQRGQMTSSEDLPKPLPDLTPNKPYRVGKSKYTGPKPSGYRLEGE